MSQLANRFASLLSALVLCAGIATAGEKVPIVYSTDLFHPHADPDDHYDLACLFAMPEFDIRGIILDLGGTQAAQPGRPAVEQMMHIAGRKVPYGFGLSRPLRGRSDKALDEPEQFQAGVKMLLSVLRQSTEPVAIFTTGSCRDVAAAFNREPDLLNKKVKAVYFNIGRGPNEPQEECNVGYDPPAYLRLFESGLPLYWCPCFGREGFETFYEADQTAVVGACTPPVRNYFVYCLTRSTADPIPFLTSGPHPLPKGPRAMWCTAPMFHAAGRKIYRQGPDDFVALLPAEAKKRGLDGKEVDAFRFAPMRATLEDGKAEPQVQLAEPASGQLAAAYGGRTKDRVGTGNPEPDGRPDCCVRVLGVAAGKPIKNVVLTGPNNGRWEHVETARWWRLAYEREGRRLDCYFQFYASGEHQIEIVYADGTTQAARFQVPNVGTAGPRVDLQPGQPNGFVFRSTDPGYKRIMASCLKNLLAGLGR